MFYPKRIALAAVGALLTATQVSAQVTFFEHDGFEGQSFTVSRPIRDFSRMGFNDRASSVVVVGERWEVCDDSEFGGRCAVLRAGRYPSLSSMGLNDRVSSARQIRRNDRVNNDRYAEPSTYNYEFQRRGLERLYQAEVSAVWAVMGPREESCWIERDRYDRDRSNGTVPGAIFGAVIGGILGHQIGGGRGQDIATAGGAVAGAAIGANATRSNNYGSDYGQDVRRCAETPTSGAPRYWDVTYTFRNVTHRIQMNTPPGRTVTVNAQGEPRS
jgi:uncharacterized protein YcfJ